MDQPVLPPFHAPWRDTEFCLEGATERRGIVETKMHGDRGYARACRFQRRVGKEKAATAYPFDNGRSRLRKQDMEIPRTEAEMGGDVKRADFGIAYSVCDIGLDFGDQRRPRMQPVHAAFFWPEASGK